MVNKTYIRNKNTGDKYCINGLVESEESEDDFSQKKFSAHMKVNIGNLPPKIDLRSQMTPVEHQTTTNSCTANALAGAYEYLLKQRSGEDVDVSRLFIYYNGRKKDHPNEKLQDKGSTISGSINVLKEYGVCLESLCPFDKTKINSRPTDDAYEAAAKNKIIDALKLNPNLNEMKACLAQGYPFTFGLRLYKSFAQAKKNGIVPMPTSDEENATKHGRHAMLAVGYSDRSKSFIVRNSWGDNWGDQGYCYIPYDYMANPKYCFLLYTIRDAETDDLLQEHWAEYDDSIDYRLEDEEEGDDDYEFTDEEEQEQDDDDEE